MKKYWTVNVLGLKASEFGVQQIQELAQRFNSFTGAEEFSLSEPEVDALLGDRSYSGGDLSLDVLTEIEEQIQGKLRNLSLFFCDQVEAEAFLKLLEKRHHFEATITQLDEKDWNNEWKKYYTPISINDQLEIVPSWFKDYHSSCAQKLFLYPGMGFGTGSHPTTFLCLKIFTECLLTKNLIRAMDFGSGSGILGLSLLKFFPELKVDFYDIDPEANKNCYHNAQINNLHDRQFRLMLPEVKHGLYKDYDLIFANILESTLIEEKDLLLSHLNSGGHLILSGILNHQSNSIKKLYEDEGLQFLLGEESGDWSALLFRKDSK